MKPLLLSILLLLTFSTNAQAPEPAHLPGEPHHHLKIDNEYIRAYYVEVAPHEDTQLHQHDHDYLFVTLGDTEVINAVLGKPEVHLSLKDGETHFTRGGFAHVARNLADAPFRNITIELLKPQAEPQNLCAQVLAGSATAVCPQTPTAYRGGPGFSVVPQFATGTFYLNLVRLEPGEKSARVAVPENSLLIILSASQIQIELQGQPPSNLRDGEIAWFGAHSQAATFNSGQKPASYLQLSFRDKVANRVP
jgi:quercetin dioxygenase-like cupin family protein